MALEPISTAAILMRKIRGAKIENNAAFLTGSSQGFDREN